MSNNTGLYSGFPHPGDIISHAAWLYHRFALSFRNVEEILWSRGVEVTYESKYKTNKRGVESNFLSEFQSLNLKRWRGGRVTD